MKHKTERLKVKLNKMIIFYLLIPFLLVFLILSVIFIKQQHDDTKLYLGSLFSIICDNFSADMERVNFASSSFALDDDVTAALRTIGSSSSLTYDVFTSELFIRRELASINADFANENGIEAALVFGGKIYTSASSDRYEPDSLLLSLSGDGLPHIAPFPQLNLSSFMYRSDRSMMYAVRGLRAGISNLNSIIIYSLPLENFWRNISNRTYQNGNLAMISSEGDILAATDEDVFIKWIMPSDSREDSYRTVDGIYYQSRFLPQFDLYLVYAGDSGVLFTVSFRMIQMLIVAFVLILCSLLLSGLRIAGKIAAPIVQLKEKMGAIEQSGKVELSDEPYITEVEELDRSFDQARNRIQSLLVSVQKETEAKEIAYYNSLQSQIRPHFLFNTLNAIQWKAELNDDTEVASVLRRLGAFLQALYKDNSENHTLISEMEFLENYVEIVNVRFANRVKFYYFLPDNMKSLLIPKFCLQPIVENSLFHGFMMQKDGMIVVRCSENENDVRISIIDNGVGSAGQGQDADKHKATGVGLSNIKERLKHLYGDQYGVFVDTSVAAGFHTEIIIPKVYGEQS